MSYENKGSMVATVVVTSGSPDESGNFVIGAADPAVVIEAAWTHLAVFGGGTLVTKGAGETWTMTTQVNSQADLVTWESDWSLTIRTPNNFDTGGNNELVSVTHDYVVLKDLHVDGNKVNQSALSVHNIAYRLCSHGRIIRPLMVDADNFGVFIRADAASHHDHLVADGVFLDCAWNAIEFNGGSGNDWLRHCMARNNYVEGCSDVGIAIRCNFSSATGNHVVDTDGTDGFNDAHWAIACEDGDSCIINDNVIINCSRGIQLQGNDDIADGNMVWNCSTNGIISGTSVRITISDNQIYINDGGGRGINLFQTSISVITGNLTNGVSGYDGISIRSTGSDDNLVSGNTFIDCDICIQLQDDSDRNYIVANKCSGTTGIQIVAATVNDTLIGKNDLRNTTTKITDAGTDTILPTYSIVFVQGTTFISADASAKGWEINAEADMAVALEQIRPDVQQVVRLRIWAVALGAPVGAGGQMHLDILFNAGGSLEAYNLAANSWTLANFDSEEADYVNTNVIHWVIEDGDVGNELSNLSAGDSIECKINGGTAADPDGATNATFRILEIVHV